MFYAVSWVIVVSVLALWSLTAWALHTVAVWAVSNVGALSGAASGAGALSLPGWLSPWVPPELARSVTHWMAAAGPWVDGLLQSAPALAGGLTVATWVVWAVGAVLLVLLGALLHLLMAIWRRRRGGGSSGSPGGGAVVSTVV
jgi:hypothetical protein